MISKWHFIKLTRGLSPVIRHSYLKRFTNELTVLHHAVPATYAVPAIITILVDSMVIVGEQLLSWSKTIVDVMRNNCSEISIVTFQTVERDFKLNSSVAPYPGNVLKS